jgi:UDP-glucose 4-epimerase
MPGLVLVTGGAGFIGSHVVRRLLADGRSVRVLDDLSTGRAANLEGVQGAVEVRRGSVADETDVRAAMAEVSHVVHLAALPSVARSLEAPLQTHHACATGTAQVLFAAAKAGARVVYAGSSSAYGNQDVPAKHEGLREDPLSPYAAAKLAGELYCRSFSRVFGLPVVVTRFFNVFGPRQVPDSQYSGVVAAFCLAALRGERPRIDGDGGQSRDFTYVEDVVDGVVSALFADTAGCETVNLAYGQSCTVKGLLDQICSVAGRTVEPVYGPPRSGDVRSSLADTARAKSLFGFGPKIGFAEGIRRTYEWYRSQYE